MNLIARVYITLLTLVGAAVKDRPPPGCEMWFDGCNNCKPHGDGFICSKMACKPEYKKDPYCKKWSVKYGCKNYFDGCN